MKDLKKPRKQTLSHAPRGKEQNMDDTLIEAELLVKTGLYVTLEQIKDKLAEYRTPELPPETFDDETCKQFGAIFKEITSSIYAVLTTQEEAIQKEIEDLKRLRASKMISADLD
jgi:hypothetical protein